MQALQVLTLLLVSITMGLALAHALEFPGKKRLPQEIYTQVQPMYYPGFTIGGAVGEFGGLVALLVLLSLTPFGTSEFWLTLAALVALLAVQAVYWTITHPVNKEWMKSEGLGAAGKAFFQSDPLSRPPNLPGEAHWTILRDRWEWSHVARAALGTGSFLFLAIAVVL